MDQRRRQVQAFIINQHQNILLGWVLVCAVVPMALAPLTWPPYYEDESWTFIPIFELLRGNFFSMGMFDQGQAIFIVAFSLPVPFVALSPLQPEETVRVFTFLCGVVALVAVFLCARRLAPRAAWVAPAVLVATPLMFPALRYGRLPDIEGLMLASLALAAAAYKRPLAAGVLSALAVSTHPIYVWLGLPCLAIAANDGPQHVRRYVIGGLLGLLPQIVWTLAHLEGHREIWTRYNKTGTQSVTDILGAIEMAGHRFETYLRTLTRWQVLFHALVYAVLPIAGVILARSRPQRLIAAALILSPIVATAVLVSSSNYYYVHYVGVPLALACALAASMLPGMARASLVVILLGATVLALDERIDRARESEGNPTQREVVSWLTRELPKDAVVMIPIMYGGLLDTRSDVRAFSYKALSLRPGWRLPACSGLDARLRTMIDDDRRSSPAKREAHEMYFVTPAWFNGANMQSLLGYMRQTYPTTQADVDCILAGPPADLKQKSFCNPQRTYCFDVGIRRRPLP